MTIARPAALALLATLLSSTPRLLAEDWPQYRGPRHDGRSTETISKSWPATGPKVLWRVPLGPGFSSFAVVGDKAFTLHERGENKEACVALSIEDGKTLWTRDLTDTIHERQGGPGPRSTPVVDGDRVYVLDTFLKLHCLSAADGKVHWANDLPERQNSTSGIKSWGSASSPVIEGDLVLVAGGGPGESILAYNKKDGKIAWKKHHEKITHATPTPATIHGVRQVIFFTQSGLVSIEPKTGDILWRYAFPFRVSTAASPVVCDDIVYCSAAYDQGAGAVRIAKEGEALTATEVWRTPKENMNHWTTAIYHDGHVYGIYGWKVYRTGPLGCVDVKTGKMKWTQSGFGQGGLIFVDGHLLVLSEEGQLVLVQASPDAYKETARAHVLGYKCWNMPVVANGRIYARSDSQAICLDVSGK